MLFIVCIPQVQVPTNASSLLAIISSICAPSVCGWLQLEENAHTCFVSNTKTEASIDVIPFPCFINLTIEGEILVQGL